MSCMKVTPVGVTDAGRAGYRPQSSVYAAGKVLRPSRYATDLFLRTNLRGITDDALSLAQPHDSFRCILFRQIRLPLYDH